MEIEEKVRLRLMQRGFNYNEILNNRGLIDATIEDTIIEVVKNFHISDVIKSVCDICEKEGENRIYCSCQNCGEIYKHKQTVL